MAKKTLVAEEPESLSGRLGEFGSAVMQIVDEKGLPKEKVIEVIEAALAAAYKRDYGKKSQVIRAEFDDVTKSTKFLLVKEVVDETVREFVAEPEEEEAVTDNRQSTTDNRNVVEEPEVIDEDRMPRFNIERDMMLEDARKIKKDAKLGDLIENVNIPNIWLLLIAILITIPIGIIIPQAIAKWALLAPIFIPLFMRLGVDPAAVLAAYRTGDSPMNIVTPIMAYFPLIVVFAARYDKRSGIGTVIALMLPYFVALTVVWTAFFLAWYALGIPWGL